MADIDYEKMAEANVRAMKAAGMVGGSTSGIGSGPAPSSSGGAGDGVLKSVAGKLDKATGGLAGEVDKSAKTWQQASNIGIGFNNDAIGLRTSIAQTRLSTDEWGDSIKKGAVGFTALGGTMTDSAKKFNQMSASFSDTTAADELRKIGFTTKEYNDVLAISLAGKKGQDLATVEGQRKANMAAADLALEMDKVAQLTGVSRREQQEALQEKQKNARVQATIELEIRKGGKDAADAYLKMSTGLKGVGLDKLGDELYTGQALSQKAIAQMNALGPAGQQLRDAINATKNAKTDEEKAAAKAMMDRAQSAVSERQRSTEYLTMVQRGQGEVAEAAGEGMIAARNYNKGIEEVQAEFKAQGKALTTEQARQVLAERAKKPVDIATGKDKTSADAAAAKSTEAYVLAQARAADTTASFAKAINEANKALTANGTATRKTLDTGLNALQNVQKSTTRPGETSTGRERLGIVNNESANNALMNTARGNFKEAGKDFGAAAATVLKQAIGAFNAGKDLANGLGNGNKATPKNSYSEGTAGSSFDISKLVKDFGKETPALLHGEEAVMTKKQLTEMVTGLGLKGGPGLGMKMPEIKMPEVKMPGAATADASTQVSSAKRNDDINRQVMEMQLASAKNGVVLDREKALAVVEEKVKKEEKAATDQKIKEAEIKAQSDRKAMLESAIKNGPADVREKAMKELAGITKDEQAKAKAAEAKEAAKPNTKGATADVKTDNKNKASSISKTVPSEIAQQKAEEERKKAAAATTAAPKPVATTAPTTVPSGKTSTLDDLNEQLKQLNKSMGELVSHTAEVSHQTERNATATKRLDPNVSRRG